jgi:hypothetical protein
MRDCAHLAKPYWEGFLLAPMDCGRPVAWLSGMMASTENWYIYWSKSSLLQLPIGEQAQFHVEKSRMLWKHFRVRAQDSAALHPSTDCYGRGL